MYKYRRFLSLSTLEMLVILFLAVGMRFLLIKLHWPITNADESIMDLMARHLAYQGEGSIFFWGQHHMGSIQAYLGAFFVHLFGSLAFSVRLGTLLIFALYLLCMYFLVRLLYTPVYALFIIALLSLGSERSMSIPLVANGGYAETMFFGALIFLLVTRLALTMPRQAGSLDKRRLLVYALLGLAIGLALWSDQLILSAILAAGVFWWLFCRGELRSWAMGAFGIGLLVGSTPLILYNISAPFNENSLFVLVGTVFSGAPRVIPYPEQFAHVFLISLPLATGMPFTSSSSMVCNTVEPYTGPTGSLAALFPSDNPALCLGWRGGWSLVILLLWGLALGGAWLALRRQRTRLASRTDLDLQIEQRQRVILCGRLMLLGSGLLWTLLFALSAAAGLTPRASCRYLICLLLATPAVLWPLWQGLTRLAERRRQGERLVRSRSGLSLLTLCLIVGAYLAGTGEIFANIPSAQESYNQTNAVIQELLSHHATRIYSNYDLCSPLIFQSDERIICGVLDNQLQPDVNRYPPYLAAVQRTAHPAYLFPIGSLPDRTLALRISQDTRYQHILFDGYSIYYYAALSG